MTSCACLHASPSDHEEAQEVEQEQMQKKKQQQQHVCDDEGPPAAAPPAAMAASPGGPPPPSPSPSTSSSSSLSLSSTNMPYRLLGRTGLKVSLLSYGTWVTFGNQVADVAHAKSLLARCRRLGVNFFDTAEVYGHGAAEEILGQAIRELRWRRSDVVLSTKIFWGGDGPNDVGASRKHIVEGLRASLRRLRLEYVDIVFCHRPDTLTPIEETVRAMNFVIDQGWAFYWGTSEWSARQITEAWEICLRLHLIAPAAEQTEYNLLCRDKVEVEFEPLYKKYGIGLTTWSPLSSGLLTGKYSKQNIPPQSRFSLKDYEYLGHFTLTDDALEKVDDFKAIAMELGVTAAQLAIAWCASNPNVSSVITGASNENQIIENMKALDAMPLLSSEIVKRIEAVMKSRPKRPDIYRY